MQLAKPQDAAETLTKRQNNDCRSCLNKTSGSMASIRSSYRDAENLWAQLSQEDYPNGAVVFCSESLAEAFHPARPLPGSVYRDGKDFDTALVREALDQSPSLAIVTIDGAEASLGRATFGASPGSASVAVTPVAHLRAHIKSRTRRGGQSAPRFGRTRDAEEAEFLQADMKRKLLKELPPELQRRVLGVLDLNCDADRDSLRLAATKAQHLVDAPGQREASAAVAEFLEQVKLGGACYGPEQTLRALRLGAVHTLLVASSVEGSWSCALADALQVAEAQKVRCLTISADSQ
ncbi:SU2, partial [Symbiodinium microadriaticum]